MTGAALRAPFRVERAARGAAIVHRAREPVCNERAQQQDDDEHGDAQEGFDQLLYLSFKL